MIEETRVVDIASQVKLHLIRSNKFKTDLIGFYIQRPLCEAEAAKNALLTRVMEQGTKRWSSLQAISHRLDELYGAILSCDVAKYGEMQALQFKMQLPNKRHIPEKNILSLGFDIIYDVIKNPLIENGKFKEDVFVNEVRNLKEEIQGRVNDKMVYAIDRCIENMCDDEPFKIHQYGSVSKLEEITNEALVAHYCEIISTSPIDIVVVGDIDFDETETMIKNQFDLRRDKIIEIPEAVTEIDVPQVREVVEKYDVKQSKLSIGLRTNISYSDSLYNASVLFSNILGGGASSKLFKNVREKESLCYYIFSRIEKYKGIMLISSGIESKNKARTVELIKQEMEKMNQGEFDASDIQIAKDALISALQSISDYPNSYMNFYFSQILGGKTYDIAVLIDRIQKVSKEDIVKVGHLMELDIIYFLTHEGGQVEIA